MRILVVGAGAIGGYFGGRLLQAGRDVTFLVRPRRAAQLAETGLIIRSTFGDANLPNPPTVAAEALREPFDLILLSCKAYDLASAADLFAPAVGANTAILPFLNGMAHMDFLAARFGGNAMLGGQCVISTTLDAEGRILHLNDTHLVSFGERDGSRSTRAEAIATTMTGARFEVTAQHRDPAGNVGKMGFHRDHRRHHLPDAGERRRYCRGKRRRLDDVAARRVRGNCGGARVCTARTGPGAQPLHVDRSRLWLRRLNASRH